MIKKVTDFDGKIIVRYILIARIRVRNDGEIMVWYVLIARVRVTKRG